MFVFRWSLVLFSMVFCVGTSFAVDNSQSLFNADDDLSYNGEAEQVNLIGTDSQQQDAFVNVIKGAVNWILGILALIALLILMYGGFQMVTSAGDDEKYKAGFTILQHAATGLILIGVAWFVVSIVFWLVNMIATGGTGTGTTGPADTEV